MSRLSRPRLFGHRWHRGPGRVRIALAAKLQAKLREIDPEARVLPEDLDPNQGYWRTDYRADVMPWWGTCWFQGRKVQLDSWDTMTDLTRRAGFEIEVRVWSIELSANDTRPHPEALRAKKRSQ